MSKKKEIFFAVREFFIILMLVSFIVTCNMVLFLHNATISEEDIRSAAPITLVNVILLSVLFTVIDRIRRYYQITKPVREIQNGLNRVMKGDYNTRIDKLLYSSYAYDSIIDNINLVIKELGSVETLRTDFIANVSHELKTPLAVIQNYGMLLTNPEITEKERIEYSNKILEQIKRLSSLIMNILKLNKLENQQIFPDIKPVELGENVCESVLDFEHIWEEKGIEIETDIRDGIYISGDSEMLKLVWSNLMSNAIKFTENGGKVSIAVKEEDGKGVVSITDTGCGMDAATGKNIFKKFYQGDTSHASAGNGLGLALVKRIVDIHKGEISVTSKLGYGSTFVVKINMDK